ncbi:DNA-directed RNA polymerase II subunit RPB1-like [Corylus avellana]|uniref:DNA-directed RNA polymerase II subunit RPB1-like n=1 Tax=Corylus avellana TaxID=13451 RepID=UPI00286D40A7|nr:DNA-directed RNA polymerase II subunit RPB1-like [Corylus avellana]
MDLLTSQFYISQYVTFDESHIPYKAQAVSSSSQVPSPPRSRPATLQLVPTTSNTPISPSLTPQTLPSPSESPAAAGPSNTPISPSLTPPTPPSPLESSDAAEPPSLLVAATSLPEPQESPSFSTTKSPSLPSSSPPPRKCKSINTLVYGTSPYHLPHAMTTHLTDPLDSQPTSYTQASQFPHWRLAMQEEYALFSTITLGLLYLPHPQ